MSERGWTWRPSTLREVVDDVERRRDAGERIVFTNGCFDLLHPGHVEGLRAAAELGDCLVVGVNSDDSVRRLKGPSRPVIPLAERLEILSALRWVDHVVSFDEDTPSRLLERIRPQVMVKGADWRERALPEAELLAGWGGEVVYVELVPGYSTTEIIERIRALPLGDGADEHESAEPDASGP